MRRLKGAFLIELDRIRPDPNQPRKNLETDTHRELTASVKEHGVLQAIAVRRQSGTNIFQIISGERRFHAAIAAGLAEIPCWIQEPQEQKILVQQLIENWQRADLHPFEIADTLGRLRDALGYTRLQLAKLTGKSASEISKLLALFDLSPQAQQLARSSEGDALTRRHLYAVSGSHRPSRAPSCSASRPTASPPGHGPNRRSEAADRHRRPQARRSGPPHLPHDVAGQSFCGEPIWHSPTRLQLLL
jgi:ParB/RepB/Spo0J family partition protein